MCTMARQTRYLHNVIKHASGVAHDIQPKTNHSLRSIGRLSSVVYACVSGKAWFVVMTADVKRRMARVPETDTDSVVPAFVDVVQVPEPSVRGEDGVLLG